MKLTINSEILKRKGLSFGDFLVMLLGYYGIEYDSTHDSLVERKLVEPDVFTKCSIVLSDNSKSLVSEVLIGSDEKVANCGIDFDRLAEMLQMLYPNGIKPGTTHEWRGKSSREIAQKLRLLVARYDFLFTEKEAMDAVKEYMGSFTPPYTDMQLLRNFILNTQKAFDGTLGMESMFMTIIENNREREQ